MLSSALVESSNIKTLAFLTTDLAIDILCFCPPDKFFPLSSILYLNLSSFSLINSYASEILAAFITSLSVAEGLPTLIFSSTVPENKIFSCNETEIFSLKSSILTSLMSLSPIVICPSVTS